MSGPLNGIRVVDMTINILGPLAGQLLGDMGADVIKVETPAGDPMRDSGPARHPRMASLFMNTNRNKRSVVLDAKRTVAHAALMRLVASADVFMHSLRPGAAERLGISYAALGAHNGKLVYAYAPGYRPDGRHRDRPAFDDVIQGESGIADMLGRSVGEPRYVPMIMADKVCGHVLASAIGMALFARERTGAGQEVVVPMLETMLAFNLTEHLWTDFDDPQGKLGYSRMFSDHRRPYATRDGHICLLAVSDEQWARLFRAMDRDDLASDARFARLAQRSQHIDELYRLVGEAMRGKTTREWRDALDAADVPNGAVNALEGMTADPYLAETGFFHRYEHPTEGSMITTRVPVQFSRTPGGIRLPPPNLGEHTESVLRELGYATAAIEEIRGGRPGAASARA